MMCMNWRAVGVFVAAILAVAVLVPGAAAAVLPLVVFALCPLFMVVAMWFRGRNGQSHRNGEELARLRAEVAELRRHQDR